MESESKLSKTKEYRGPNQEDYELMPDALVNMILRTAGFSSPEEVKNAAADAKIAYFSNPRPEGDIAIEQPWDRPNK